jgi:SET domain-containing protein
LVIEYTGEKIKDAEGDRRFERMMRGKGPKHSYLFTVGRALLDGSVGGSGAEYINHSCQPNLITYEVRGHILLYSRRIIRPGEELTYDYRFAADAVLYPCHCGTRRCRGTINLLPKRTRRTVRN